LDVRPEAGFHVEIAGSPGPAVATIVLDNPQRRNPQTPHTWRELLRVSRELPATVRVVVLRGEGPSFSAGLDRRMFDAGGVPGSPSLRTLAASPIAEAGAAIAAWQRAFDWRSRPDVISVAAVQGHAVGAGFQLALGTDVRICAEDVSFAMAEATLGLVPDLGGTKRLVDLVGYGVALELCVTGRRVGAAEALRLGIANAVVPAGELDAAVDRMVQAVLAVDRDAAAETKALVLAASGRGQLEQEEAEREAQYRRLRTLAGLFGEDEPPPSGAGAVR
jgi:enoyl-CoA hydratase/carnithine racemase